MRVLVTGGAGFIGSHVVETLLERGESVIAVDDFNEYYLPERKRKNIASCLSDPDFRLYEADIRDELKLGDIFAKEKPTHIVHIAARAGVRPSLQFPQLYYEVNILGTKNILALAEKHKVKHIVFSSSSSVYGSRTDPPFRETDDVSKQISPYAQTKKKGENLCKEFYEKTGIPVNVLRFFTVYGPRGRPDMAPWKFVSRVLRDEPIDVYGDGSSQRDYTYVDDIRNGVIGALDNSFGFEIFNIGNNQPVVLKDFISTIERITGKKARIHRLPMQEGDVPMTCADIDKAKRMLGYNPKISLDEGLRRFVEWYRKESH